MVTTAKIDRWAQASNSRFWLYKIPGSSSQHIRICRTNHDNDPGLATVHKKGDRIKLSYLGNSVATLEEVQEMASALELACTIAANFDDYYQA